MRLPLALALSLLLLCPACAHYEPPETESARAQRIEVREEGTKHGKPYIKLAFRPLPREAAFERLTPEEARVLVQAIDEAFVGRSRLWVSYPQAPSDAMTEVSLYYQEQWRSILGEYAAVYGSPNQPLPETIPDGKFATAFMLSAQYMPEGVRAGAIELFSSRAVIMAIVASGLTYLGLWLAPDPTLSKIIATGITISLMAVYGVSEIINVAKAFMQFYRDVKASTNMAQLDAAAKRFGEAIGKVGVRIMAMVAGGAVSKRLPDTRVPDIKSLIPQVRQLMAAGPSGAKVVVSVVEGTSAQVNVSNGTAVLVGVSVSTSGAAATTAMASARTTGDCRPESNKGNAQRHHIATDKNRISTENGGPWTPLFEELFSRIGMSLDDPANIVFFVGHQGPHPEKYHREVYRRLEDSLKRCKTQVDCRARFIDALNEIAGEICSPGTTINRLLRKD